MVGGGFYAPEEDQAIADAVRAGAWRDRDFRDLASRLGRSAAAVRERALKLGLVQRAERSGAPARPWSDSENSILLKVRAAKVPQRQIAKILGRSPGSVQRQLAVLDGRVVQPSPPRDSAPSAKLEALDRAAQAKACAKHARACLAAGGFWALSERRVGRSGVVACLPLIPPPARLEEAA
ncbi:hypothetical protein [Phenylobacterium sp.]|uniref:hypothetical protein n=1 Tax=Phenylobacterium sp. TaxID=1871053 RepID=UPI0025FDC339|nr:hypothetical protein [Phenylobacterium sp.]MCA3742302.1 hypothetical protein [Phenylobacterium sp.]